MNRIITAPYSTGPWHHWVAGIGPAAAVPASFGQGSLGRAAAWWGWVWGTDPAGWGTGRLDHTAAHYSLAEDKGTIQYVNSTHTKPS